MALTGEHLIGGEFKAAKTGAFTAFDSNKGAELPTSFAEATLDEVDEALRLADGVFDELQAAPTEKFVALLNTIADMLEGSGDELLERIHAETALPLARLQGERGRTVGQTRRLAKLVENGGWVQARIDRGDPGREPLPKPDVRTLMTAIGPIAMFGASNFPLAISVAGTDTMAAFAARCPVVVKGHPAHPGACEMISLIIAQAIEKVGLPAGMFSLLQGAGYEVGLGLVKHPLTAAVAFTGSLRGGRALMDAAAARPDPIPVYAEMGSTNPVFVLPKVAKERGEQIAQGYVQSVTLGVGQFCTNPGLLLLPTDAAESFAGAVKQAATEAPAAAMLHPGIYSSFCDGVSRISDTAGVERVTAASDSEGNKAECSVFMTDQKVYEANEALGEEVFGPASIMLRCDQVEQMYEFARNLEGHLTATIHGSEAELAEHAELVRLLERRVGRIIFNGFPTGIEVCAAMNHGGPYPATSHSGFTSIGPAAICRFVKPTCFQNFPDACLPPELQDANPRGIPRLVDDQLTSEALRNYPETLNLFLPT